MVGRFCRPKLSYGRKISGIALSVFCGEITRTLSSLRGAAGPAPLDCFVVSLLAMTNRFRLRSGGGEALRESQNVRQPVAERRARDHACRGPRRDRGAVRALRLGHRP